jgi:hypothetical protein
MKCPLCKTHVQYADIDLHVEGFNEEISTCRICGTIWSVNHGAIAILEDPQEKSFLEARSECVEAYDYGFAA